MKKYIFIMLCIALCGCDNKNDNMSLEQKEHLTEIALDNYSDFDYIIDNNNTFKDLEKQVLKIMEVEHE